VLTRRSPSKNFVSITTLPLKEKKILLITISVFSGNELYSLKEKKEKEINF